MVPGPIFSQEEIKKVYSPDVNIKRQIPSEFSTGLWLTAYTTSIYLLSRLKVSNYALGAFYFLPSMAPFYRWAPENHEHQKFELTGENYVFAGLSAYNFLVIYPDKQSVDEVFRDNLYANVALWGGLWLSRKYMDSTKSFFFPVTNASYAGFGYYMSF